VLDYNIQLKKMAKAKKKAKEDFVKLNMTFEEAMKKALNTPLQKKQPKKKTK
jgi:hypothetical protein